MSDEDIIDNLTDNEVIAKTMWGEARGEGYVGQQAVCNVIFNRAEKPSWWGHSPRTVCLKPYQFSCWNQSDPNRPKLMEVTADDSIYSQSLTIVRDALSGDLPDVTNGADSYCVIGTNPSWAAKLTPCATIGKHEFFRTI